MTAKYSLKAIVILLSLFTGLVLFKPVHALAYTVQQTDTISTADVEFTDVAPAKADTTVNTAKAPTAIKAAGAIGAKETEKPKTLWQIFVAGLLGGFAALVMPCIYPLLPLTVSFFTKKAGSRGKGIIHSIIYGVSIIVLDV
jgi:thiol:disulfide interchange protein